MTLSTEIKSMLFGTGDPFQVSSPENSIDSPRSEISTYAFGFIDLLQGKAPENAPMDLQDITPTELSTKLYYKNPRGIPYEYKISHKHVANQWSGLYSEKICTIWKKDTLSFPIATNISLTSSAINSPSKYIAEHFVLISKAFSSELNEALQDIQELTNEAFEEGFLPPSDKALNNAKRLLKEMYAISSRRYEIYPTPDNEIAIDAPGGYGRSVILLCGSDGGALCLVNMNGKHRRARYSSIGMLPDGFLREALAELEREFD